MVKTEKFGMTFTLYTHVNVKFFKFYMPFQWCQLTCSVTGVQEAQLPLYCNSIEFFSLHYRQQLVRVVIN